MLSDLVVKGAEINACGTCLRARGINDSELAEGVQRGTMMNLANWIKDSEKVVSF